MRTEERMIAVNDLDQKRIFNALRRLKRKGYSTSRVWVYSRKNAQGRLIRTLIAPESYLCALTPMMRDAAVLYNGKLR